MLGRGLRRKARPAILLDHAGNMLRHGLPDDDREWELNSEKKKKKKVSKVPEVKIRVCEKCYSAHSPAPTCPYCGFAYPVVGRDIEEVEGELAEINANMVRAQRRKEIAKAKTYEDFLAIAADRGYRPRWAMYMWEARQSGRAA